MGGGLEYGETPEQCIRREAAEEISCALHNLKLFDVRIHYEEICYLGVVFTATIDGTPVHNEEILQVRWIPEDEIGQYEFITGGKERLIKYYSENRRK